MAPIRVGLVGLSGQSPEKYEGASWTANAHLPYLKASPHFEIVALLNTTAESARAAIARYELPATTKAYGKPEDLAADGDVDLVVCSTRVDQHFSPVKPSIIAGKAIFVEWPLGASIAIAREMLALAKKHNAVTIVGLQGSYGHELRTLKKAVEGGRIGKIVSSSWSANFGNAGPQEKKNLRYFLDRKIGGNVISIGLGHALEFVNYVLGDFKNFESVMSIGHPTVDIIDPANSNKVIDKGVKNTVPDQIKIIGTLSASNAPISLHWRGGKVFPGAPCVDWQVVGQEGILRLTSSTWGLNVGAPDTKIDLFDLASGDVQVLEVESDEWAELPIPARNIAKLYESYRKGEWWPNWEWAVERHELLEKLWQNFDESNMGSGLANL